MDRKSLYVKWRRLPDREHLRYHILQSVAGVAFEHFNEHVARDDNELYYVLDHSRDFFFLPRFLFLTPRNEWCNYRKIYAADDVLANFVRASITSKLNFKNDPLHFVETHSGHVTTKHFTSNETTYYEHKNRRVIGKTVLGAKFIERVGRELIRVNSKT